MSLSNFTNNLFGFINQSQTIENCSSLINKIIKEKNCQLWSLSDDPNEYNRYHRMLDGSLKNTIDVDKLNNSLLMNASDYFRDKNYFIVLHDPSEIRKPYSEKSGELCKVKDFDGKLINGYKTHNSAVINYKGKELRLLQSTPYSTSSSGYIKQSELKDYHAGKITDTARKNEIEQLLAEGKAYNLKSITKKHTQAISDAIRKENPEAIIVDVYDRGFDDAEIFEFETSINNFFVIRGKLSRNSNELEITQDGKEKLVKLKHQVFFKSTEKYYDKVHFRNKLYYNIKGVFEWNYVEIKNKTYSVVRVGFYQRNGQRLFKEPMLLITNMDVETAQLAETVFEIYMKRSKIEGTFRFCKDVLGWEQIQIPEFNTVKNLLTLVYFVSAYFYEIEDELTKDSSIQWLAEFGGGKSKVTRYYVLNGIARLIAYKQTQQYIKEHNISQQQIDQAVSTYTLIL